MLETVRTLGAELEVVSVVCMGLVLLLRLPDVVRPGQLRVLWAAVATAAAAIALNLDVVTEAISVVAGLTHLSTLARDLCGVVAVVAVVYFVLVTAVADRRVRWLLGGAGAVVVVGLLVLDLVAPSHAEHRTPVDGCPIPCPAYWAVLALVHLAADVSMALLCWRYGRSGENPLLRLALRLFGLGATFFVLFWASAITYLVARLAWIPAFFGLLVGCGGLFLAAAVSVPLAQSLRTRLTDLRSYWLLWPLWRDLVEAVPRIALVHPRSRLWDLLSGIRPLGLLLYRQVIEIRDAILVMADHTAPEVVRAARDHVAATDLRGRTASAAVMACWVEVARLGGRDGSARRCDLPAVAEHGGENLPAEIGFLLTVARVRRSALVRSFVEAIVSGSGPGSRSCPCRTSS